MNDNGTESPFSNEEEIFVNFVSPGQNIIKNGDFERGSEFWDLGLNNAQAELNVTSDGELHVQIQQGGDEFWHIQLRQNNIPLVQGNTYRFEFDAYSTRNRIIDAKLERAEAPWDNYGRINPTALRRAKQRFAYEFVMQEPSDNAARMVFNCGGSVDDVFIDNVSLTLVDGEAPLEAFPSPWQHEDVGQPAIAGDAGLYEDRIVIRGSGNDIWGTRDQFHFAYQKVSGDMEVSARVISMSETHGWAKAGVMVRNSLDPGSEHAFMCATVNNGVAFQRRPVANESSLNDNTGEHKTPYWVKLIRRGNRFTGFASADGEEWEHIASETIEMNDSVFIGLAVTSHTNNALCEAQFDDLRLVTESGSDHKNDAIPETFVLYPSYPNPFNQNTAIRFYTPTQSRVTLEVFDVRGRYLRKTNNPSVQPGHHSISLNAEGLSSGLLFYHLTAYDPDGHRQFSETRKMMLIK